MSKAAKNEEPHTKVPDPNANGIKRPGRPPRRLERNDIIKPKDIRLANAIKIGQNEVNYFSDKKYDIEIKNNMVIKISNRPRRAGEKTDTVYTTVMNTLSWRL